MKTTRIVGSLILLLLCVNLAGADDLTLKIDDVPAHGVVMGWVDLTDAMRWCESKLSVENLRAELLPGGAELPIQFVADTDFDPADHAAGTVILKLPGCGPATVKLRFDSSAEPVVKSADESLSTITVETKGYRAIHDATRMGGLPSKFEFVESGKSFERFRWNDRLHDPKRGGFCLSNDLEPVIERVSVGPIATVVRVRARYFQTRDRIPDSHPAAVYDWYYFCDMPLIYVTAAATQQPVESWREAHFLELNFPGDDFTNWAGGEPTKSGAFTGETRSFPFSDWGALVQGRDAIAMLDAGRVLFYDHKGGSYIQARGDRAWQTWNEASRSWSAWLWIGSTDKIADTIQAARKELPSGAKIGVGVASIDRGITAAQEKWQNSDAAQRRQTWWRVAAAARLSATGRFAEATAALDGKVPESWTVVDAGRLGAIFQLGDDGIALLSLFDTDRGRELLAPRSEPLFELTVRNRDTKEEIHLTADAGWQDVGITPPAESTGGITLHWRSPTDRRVGPLEVCAVVTPDETTDSLSWQLSDSSEARDDDAPWSIHRTVFPKLAIGELGERTDLFVPRGAGEVIEDATRKNYNFGGRYPSGWTTMQYMAAYADDGTCGFYVAVQDPSAGTKEMRAETRSADRCTIFTFDHPAIDMGTAAARHEIDGAVVWRIFDGDWFDAATIYRDWVRREARWYPKLTDEGRADTPRWMRDLDVWALGGGDPKTGLPMLQEFARELGVPVGFHWYSWHRIPFDNDYPHYFPADEGFADAVALLEGKGVHVMPYINGRLWDTRDRDCEDFEFTKLALSAATKNASGEPFLESYSSKESDDSRVRLAVMCPSTELWQGTIRDVVRKLTEECGVSGVYIDQIAAAKPELCLDASHGHPTGGGHWWVESYWQMLEKIRQAIPQDRILTTECNAEPYIKWFDGYLTWHWQNDGQVPAFPAVYGGSIQMFGRAYRGGPDKDQALRMKAAQQLVFGEQIGWLSPDVVREKENFAFLRDIVQVRQRLRSYFTTGEMARPPAVSGEIPDVTADWQWSGEWPVTTSALLRGAWRIPRENRVVLILVNVIDKPITVKLDIDADRYGIPGERVQVATSDEQDNREETTTECRKFQREITLQPRNIITLELSPSTNL